MGSYQEIRFVATIVIRGGFPAQNMDEPVTVLTTSITDSNVNGLLAEGWELIELIKHHSPAGEYRGKEDDPSNKWSYTFVTAVLGKPRE